MPNWCSNTILVNFGGSTEAKNFFTNLVTMYRSGGIDKMANTLESKLWTESVEKVSKCPDDGWAIGGSLPGLLNMLAPLDENSYELNCSTWGTKWDIPSIDVFESLTETSCQLGFDSAWSPPIEALRIFGDRLDKVCTESARIHIDFNEPGMSYMGYADKDGPEWILETRSMDEAYTKAKAGDTDSLEFLANCGTCLEDMGHMFEDVEDVLDLGGSNADNNVEKCGSCGDNQCDDLDHLLSDNKSLPEDLKIALTNFRDMLDAQLSAHIRKIGDKGK